MAAVKFSFNMDDTQIDAGIKSIGRKAKSLRVEMHKVAVSILVRWAEARDVRAAADRALALLNNADDAHKQKVVNWFAVYAGFTLEDGEEGKEFSYSNTTISAETVQAARKESMFDLSKDPAPKPFDLPAQLQSLIKRAEKALGREHLEKDNVSREQVNALKAALLSLSTE